MSEKISCVILGAGGHARISEFTIVEAGAVVVKKVPPNTTVMDAPAKIYSGKARK